MATPLLSIFLSNFNHSRYLKQCFAGFVNQTFADFEIVMVDDGSTDGSQDIIREFERQDSRFKVKYFEKNRGIAAAFQDNLSRIQGKYVYGGASDDFVANKDFFAKAVRSLEGDERPAGFFGINGIYQAEKEKLVEAVGTAEVEGYNTPLQCYRGFLNLRSVVTSPSCIWRTKPYLAHGGGDFPDLIKHMGPQSDFFLCHALAFRYGMSYEKTLFSCQRVFEAKTNYSSNMHLWETAARFAEMERRLRAIEGLPNYPQAEQDWMKWRAFWMQDTIRKSGVLNPPAA